MDEAGRGEDGELKCSDFGLAMGCIGGGSIVRGECSGSSRLQLRLLSPGASRLPLCYLLHGSVCCAERFRRPRSVLGV